MTGGKRIKILSKDEEKYLYDIPDLTNEERMVLFDLSEADYKELSDLPDDAARIDYVLQLGYFRATNYLFKFSFQKVSEDVWFIINNFFPTVPFPKKLINKNHHYDNQKIILNHLKFTPYSAKVRVRLEQHAKKLAKRHMYPRFIFDELLSYCQQMSLVRPAYSRMQSIVSNALKHERKRVTGNINRYLDKHAKSALDDLLETEDSFYRITLLKKDPKDFLTSEMRTEVNKQKVLEKIYDLTRTAMAKLKISSKNVEYYADMATYYPPFNLKRFSKSLSRLYLLCYVHKRFFKVNDHLITFFSYRVNKFYQDGEQLAKEKMSLEFEEAEERHHKAKKLIKLFSDKRIKCKRCFNPF